MPPPFLPGVDLARLFYTEVVGPLLETECPGLAYSAALIGWGSEVLGSRPIGLCARCESRSPGTACARFR